MEQLPPRKQGEYQNGYFWQDELVFGQCDAHLNLRVSSLIEHLVTISSQHIRSFGMTYESFLASDRAFVLTRCSLTIHSLPRCFQLITLHSWIDDIKGPYYQRVTQWRDNENRLLVSGRSDWVLMQPSTRTLCKPDKTDTRFTTKSPVTLPPCEKVKVNQMDFQLLGIHKVVYSEIDGNAHLHCAHYGDFVWDFLPSHLQKSATDSFHIEFMRESCLDDEISIFGAKIEPNIYVIKGEVQGDPCFKSKIYFACEDSDS